jgi:hypothetical protein
MNLIVIKTGLFFLLMVVLFITAFTANDEVYIKILSSLAIITGALILKLLTPKNSKENE